MKLCQIVRIKQRAEKQHRVSDVCLTVLARPVKSCSSAQRVFDRRSVETAGRGGCLKLEGFSPTSTIQYMALSMNSFFLSSLFSCLLYLTCFLLPSGLIFPVFPSFLPPLLCFVLLPSAELREGWYTNECVALLRLPQIFFSFTKHPLANVCSDCF